MCVCVCVSRGGGGGVGLARNYKIYVNRISKRLLQNECPLTIFQLSSIRIIR